MAEKHKDYASTYDQIREGKIRTMKDVLLESSGFGPFAKCADVFTDDELVKSFDFFNQHGEKEDDDVADNGMWCDFLEESKSFLSKKSYKLLRACNE